jgi:ATP-dependent Lon protease
MPKGSAPIPIPGKKKKVPPPSSDDDSSVDSKGNLRDLIDYDYEESEEERPVRSAAKKARKIIKKIIKHGGPKDIELPKKTVSPTLSIIEPPKKKHISPQLVVKKSKQMAIESEEDTEESYEESEETEETEEEESEEEETEDESEDMSEEMNRPRKRKEASIDIVISDMFGGEGRDPNKPVKYNLKKEPALVKRFVELVQKEEEDDDNIDTDITYFKSLIPEKQNSLLKVLEYKASPAEVTIPIKFKILEKVAVYPGLQRIAMAKYNALCNIDPSSTEYYKCSHWIDGFTGLPLGVYKDLPVKMEDGPEKCGAFMDTVRSCMDSAIYGHDDAKLQIMQFVSSWIANPKSHGNVLSIHGPPGIGKTSLIKDGVAKALARPFHFITLGGATDASFLDGHSYTYEGSTWGKIVDVLIQSKCMNPIFYFDELDKVSETPKGEEIMNMLIHLTDGSQNDRFQDKYFTGINLDLSRCLFIFSHNNHEKVNPILKDRMYNIAVEGFNVKQKIKIAEDYLVGQALREVGLFEKVMFSRDMIEFIIETYTNAEPGVRELKRCIQTVVNKINLLRFYNHPKQIPFAIEGFALPFTLQKSHLEKFLKRKEINASHVFMYM